MVELIDGVTLKEWMDSGREVILVDARAQEDHAVDHLPAAVSLLNGDVEARAEGLLPKGATIVVYSNDDECPASGLVAARLDKMGFGPVYNYNDSYRDWVSRGYRVEPGPLSSA